MQELDIGEVSRRSGLPASALRFYEEKGLIKSVGRRGLRRQYGAAVLDRLALIALGRSAGFTLDEIAGMFAPDGKPRIDRAMLEAKADELDKTIRELSAMRDGLRHAAACRAPSHAECPTFRRMMRAALSGTIGKKKLSPRRQDLKSGTKKLSPRRQDLKSGTKKLSPRSPRSPSQIRRAFIYKDL